MKYTDFLSEGPRVEPIAPSADTEKKKKLREPGDVGKVERLQQVDKDKKGPVLQRNPNAGYKGVMNVKKRNVANPRQYVDRVADEAGQSRMDPDKDEVTYKRQGNKIVQNVKPRRERIVQADKDLDAEILDAQTPNVSEPVDVKGEKIGGVGYLRHGYQGSGVGMNKVIDKDDIDYLIGATKDEKPVKKKKGAVDLEDRGGIENTKMREPTARDLEQLDPEAEKQGSEDRSYLTPEVMEQQKALRDALETQDSQAVQDIAFQHEVSEEMIDEFIGRFGKARDTVRGKGKHKLLARLEGNGATAPMTARYGGDLGKEGEDFKNKDGTYNLEKMSKVNPDLYAEAVYNRSREMVRTYLRQGGKDAYASHEGIRSIADMDLEHIRSLKAAGREGGLDDPSNWVWASGELNRLRGERDLTGDDSSVAKYAQGERVTDREGQGPTFDEFIGDDKDKLKDFKKEFGGYMKGGKGYGIFAAGKYDKLTPSEVAEYRSRAKKFGFRDDQVMSLFPDANPRRPDLPTSEKDKYGVEIPAYKGPGGRKAYDDAVTAKARNKVRYQDLVTTLKKIHKGMNEKDVLATPEGQAGLKDILTKPETKREVPVRDEDDEF